MQEFASNAAAALHLTELNQYIPHLDLWLMGLLAVLGLLCCFFGYKLHKLWFAGVCLVFGCLAGTLVGVFFFPWGLVLGPFGGAFLGELVAGKTTADAVRGGVGALLGFLVSVVLKLASVGFCAVLFVEKVFA